MHSREWDFLLRQQYPLVHLATLKQREDKAEHRAVRRTVGVVPHRLVPLSDAQYVTQLEMMIATRRILIERTWLDVVASEGVSLSVPVTLLTFRYSYAMHMLYAGTPLKALQSLLGHKSVKSTEIFTRVFALDVAARHRVQFQMPGNEAVAMLRKG